MQSRIILAADELNLPQCLDLTSRIGGRLHAVKVHNLWDDEGPTVVKKILDAGAKRVWIDMKLHDTPDTVRRRARSIAKAGAGIITVHAAGEVEMMIAAMEGVREFDCEIYAVTELTSLEEEQVHLLSGQSTKASVLYRARLAKLAGVHGVVCSAKVVGMLTKRPELKGLKRTVPGVRSVGQDVHDQKQVDTPLNAILNDATQIVVGRQLTQAKDPVAALDALEAELAEVNHAQSQQKDGQI